MPVSSRPQMSEDASSVPSRFPIIALVGLLIISLGAFTWAFVNYKNAQKTIARLSDPTAQQAVAEEEVQKYVEKVGKLMVLSSEEKPLLATVQDAENLKKEQAFFKDAQNGDIVLIYQDKAILYSETQDKIVNVGPVYIQDKDGQSAPVEQVATDAARAQGLVVVEVRNGTATTGLARTVGNQFATSTYAVSSVGDAAKKDYATTVIVNSSGKNVTALEQQFGVTAVTALPEGEAASTADVLVILGTDAAN
jgi:hypothetical protein